MANSRLNYWVRPFFYFLTEPLMIDVWLLILMIFIYDELNLHRQLLEDRLIEKVLFTMKI